jgi:hypothetical protein
LLLLNLKTSRPDGTLIKDVHPYRRLLWYILPHRSEPIVYYDTNVNCKALLKFIEEKRKKYPSLDVTHCVFAAIGIAGHKHENANRFVSGYRLYQRNGVYVTFSMKRKKMNMESKLSMVKLKLPKKEPFADLYNRIEDQVSHERSGSTTNSDRLLSILDKIPRPFLRLMIKAIDFFDYYNLLPSSFIEDNGLCTSIFVANLGSLGMDTAYHHLYEMGNCPLFMTIGKIHDAPAVEEGSIKVQKQMPCRWTFDERIGDALTISTALNTVQEILENPYEYLDL